MVERTLRPLETSDAQKALFAELFRLFGMREFGEEECTGSIQRSFLLQREGAEPQRIAITTRNQRKPDNSAVRSISLSTPAHVNHFEIPVTRGEKPFQRKLFPHDIELKFTDGTLTASAIDTYGQFSFETKNGVPGFSISYGKFLPVQEEEAATLQEDIMMAALDIMRRIEEGGVPLDMPEEIRTIAATTRSLLFGEKREHGLSEEDFQFRYHSQSGGRGAF